MKVEYISLYIRELVGKANKLRYVLKVNCEVFVEVVWELREC